MWKDIAAQGAKWLGRQALRGLNWNTNLRLWQLFLVGMAAEAVQRIFFGG